MEIRTIIVIFGVVIIKGMILTWWDNFKDRKAAEPTPLSCRKGVYVPWGPVEKIQHYGWRITQVWLVWMAAMILALIYIKIIAPHL